MFEKAFSTQLSAARVATPPSFFNAFYFFILFYFSFAF